MSCSQSRGSSAATSLGGLIFLSTGCYSAFLSCSGLTECTFSLYFSKPWLYSALSGLSCTKNCIDGMKVSTEKNPQPLRYDELAAISVVKMVSRSWLLTTLWWIHFHARDGLLFQRSLIETWSSYFQKFKVLLAGKSCCSILQSRFLFAVASLRIFWVGTERKVELTTLEKRET